MRWCRSSSSRIALSAATATHPCRTPITVKEAALGGEVRAPTPTGSVMFKIPKRSNTGDVLRLRGKGVKKRDGAGDELVKLMVMMPTKLKPELEAFIAGWTPSPTYDPRKEM